jgi:ribosomal-protein-alanine acetyltransferase
MPASITPLTALHLDAILEIQKGVPEASQWSHEDYVSLLHSGACGWIASADGAVCGFLLTRIAADEMEILNLAVELARRRSGIGSILLDAAMNWARQNRVSKVHLEVRASNQAALHFYEAHGFRQAARRSNYYRDPNEDAVLLSAEVS